MAYREFRRNAYHFDLAIGVLALLIAGACLGVAGDPSWGWREWGAVASFGAASVVIGATRTRAYTQRRAWLCGAFFVVAIAAAAIVFSRLSTLWFLTVFGLAVIVLVLAAAARRKTLAEPLTRYEFFALVATGLGVLAAVALLEVCVRLSLGLFDPELQRVLGANPENLGVAHPYIGHLHTPRSSFVVSGRDFKAIHNVDEVGFRNRWPWPVAPIDVVVVGDSVAFGYGAADDKAWPAVLSQSMRGLRLVNLSLVGAGPQQYFRVFETFGASLRPKVVLVGLWASNDFSDAVAFDTWDRSGIGGNFMVWRDFSGAERRVEWNPRHPLATLDAAFRSVVYPWMRRSYVYNLVWEMRGGWGRFQDSQPADKAPETTRRESRAFQLTVEALVRLQGFAAERNTRALIVLQPSKIEVNPPVPGGDPVDLTSELRTALDERGIEYLDLAPAFRAEAARGTKLYFEVDGHPNATGYALIARLVGAHLERHRNKYGL